MIAEKTEPTTREDLFIGIYQRVFPNVVSFIRKMGGSLDEAQDIFQDALIIYYEKNLLLGNKADNETQYITGISRHLWFRKYNKDRLFLTMPELWEPPSEKEEAKVSEKLLHFVERSGKKCLELLTAFYYDKLNMRELAEKFGFSGERSATTQKFKCLEKVREGIKNRSLSKEDFYE